MEELNIEIVEDKPKKSKKILIFIIIAVLCIGGALAYFIINELNKPKEVIEQVLINLGNENNLLKETDKEIIIKRKFESDEDTITYDITINKESKLLTINKNNQENLSNTLHEEEYNKIKKVVELVTPEDVNKETSSFALLVSALEYLAKDQQSFTDSSTFREHGNEVLNSLLGENNTEEDIKEVAIDDSKIISKLKKNVDMITQTKNKNDITPVFYVNNLYKQKVIENISKDEKLPGVILNSKEVESKDTSKIAYSLDSIVENYNKLYDDKITLEDLKNISLDGFSYNEDNDAIYFDIIKELLTTIAYKYNYQYMSKNTNLGEFYYVYQAVGYDEIVNSGYNVYSSYLNTDKAYLHKDNTKYKFEGIDISNYQDFDHYKFTFLKNSSGNYIFQKIEKID